MMLGSYVSASAQSTPTAEAERFFAGLLGWAGVSLPVTVTGSPVEVRHTESGRDAILFVFNHGTAPAQSGVSLARVRGDYVVTDLVRGGTVPSRGVSNGVALRLDLAAMSVRVLRVSPR